MHNHYDADILILLHTIIFVTLPLGSYCLRKFNCVTFFIYMYCISSIKHRPCISAALSPTVTEIVAALN